MKKLIKWNIPSGETIIPQSLLDIGLSPLLAAILYVRGLGDAVSASAFISGENEVISAAILDDIEPAIERIRMAVANHETVAVFGDYDVDGITSTCLLADYLVRYLGLKCIPYIPSRLTEGYGLNNEAISALHERGVSLIITVDCGITAIREAEFAKSIGVDMIITDHHECQAVLPDACAVIDPKRNMAVDTGRALAGVGVAFRLVCALHGDTHSMLEEYSDLVAIGTVADVMPLTGENRMLVRTGLRKIADNPRAGIAALMSEAGADIAKTSSTTIGFTLSPRLNAAGRLGCAIRAAALVMEPDADKAKSMAEKLCDLNRKRQEMEREIWQEALQMLENHPNDEPIVLVSDTWHQGVVGIVASRLSEAYMLPAIMICLEGDKGKGSCRSCFGFNLFEALTACSEHLDGFGGHALAAGLSVDINSVEAFRVALAQFYKENLPTATLGIDFDINISDPELLSIDCVRSLAMLEPCGNGNPRPRMCMVGARLTNIVHMGGGKHLRLNVEKNGKSLECVYFSHTAEELGIKIGDMLDIGFYPQVNEYRGRSTVQLVLSELRAHEPYEQCMAILNREIGYIEHCPARADFAVLWRKIATENGHLSGSFAEIISELTKLGLAPQKLCTCIAVFDEIGLLDIAISGDSIDIRQNSVTEKRDLNSSLFYQKLIRGSRI